MNLIINLIRKEEIPSLNIVNMVKLTLECDVEANSIEILMWKWNCTS